MTKAHSLRTLVILISCLLLAGGAFAAEMVGFGDGASWNLDKADFGGVMTIAGPDNFSMSKSFGAGETPSFSVWNKAGYALAPGQYKWNITLNAAKAERGDAAPEKAASFSGTFRIEGGSIVVPKASGFGDSDTGFNKDQVFLDDLIVVGSICVGQDCSNGESFGFDTLRLKENNLRIKAQDTSTSASFPTNDWQITFNDSSNGGPTSSPIDDIDGGRTPFTIEAGARQPLALRRSRGIGVRHRTQPGRRLHLKEGNTPTLRLEQDGSSGFTPQTWDLAGNETNFFIRDATNGSDLPFRIFPNAGSDALIIEGGTGDIGLGTTNPAQDLHILDNSAAANFLVESNTSAAMLLQDTGGADSGEAAQFLVNGETLRIRGLTSAFGTAADGIAMNLEAAGGVGVNCNGGTIDQDFIVAGGGNVACNAAPRSWINAGDTAVSGTSSRTYKENLKSVAAGDILDRISTVDVYQYDFINGPENKLGLMAEDFHTVFGRGSDKVLNSQEVQMALWLAVKELTAQNRELADKINELEQGYQN